MNTVNCVSIASLFWVSTVAVAQESEPNTDAERESAPRTETGECLTSTAIVDYTVLDDRAVYVQTRSRHFLLSMRGECDDLRRAYNRSSVRFVPFGRRICPNDGSHLLYERDGRDRVCPVGAISEVENRQQARELAETLANPPDEPLVITRDIDPEPRDE